jgi:hypothetical protein
MKKFVFVLGCLLLLFAGCKKDDITAPENILPPEPEPSSPLISINLFQNKEVIDTAHIKITVVDTAKIREVLFFVDDVPVKTFDQNNISFIWELSEFEDGSLHKIYCTAKNIYNKIDSTEIFDVYTYNLDTVTISNLIASEDSIYAEWSYPGIYFDSFHILFSVRNENNLVFSDSTSVPEMTVTYTDSLNYFYDYTLEIAAEYKGHKAIKYITKHFEINPIPLLDSLLAPNRISPSSHSHVNVKVKVTSRDSLKNINFVHLYLYRPDSSNVRFTMYCSNLNTLSGFYSYLMSLGPGNVPVLGTYRLEVEATHKNGNKSKRLKKYIIFD